MVVKRNKKKKNVFRSTLFWDVKDVDLKKNANFVIARVLDYGDEKDIAKLRAIYADRKIVAVVKQCRGLMPITAKYWAAYFKIPLKEIKCLKKCYQKMRLMQ
ncbi:MAG: hypothetical protein HZA48_08210 [Planctomycetes bacterium]|nr:hypothetical protein [Planctomycetota bacterium]